VVSAVASARRSNPDNGACQATGHALVVSFQGVTMMSEGLELVQPTGARTFVQFPFGGVDVTAELPAHSVERSGTTAQIVIDMTRTILIEPQSERVLSDGIEQ
jgi:hypothetical protein